MNEYYIYAHIRKDNNTIFYVGKGKGKRAYIKSNRSAYWKRIVSKYGYDVIFLETGLNEIDAYKKEITLISTYKKAGGCEANFTIGGDGVMVDNRWWGDKISKSLTGIKRAKGIDNKSFKDIITKDELVDMYINKGLNTIDISKITGLSIPTICNRLDMYEIRKRKAGRRSVTIQCINDGKIFNSISEASDYYGLYRENIRKVLKGHYNHTGGKKFIII